MDELNAESRQPSGVKITGSSNLDELKPPSRRRCAIQWPDVIQVNQGATCGSGCRMGCCSA